MAGTANNGGEDSTGSIITGEASLAHARAVVDNESSSVFVTHFGYLFEISWGCLLNERFLRSDAPSEDGQPFYSFSKDFEASFL